jgi:hypothetical protein
MRARTSSRTPGTPEEAMQRAMRKAIEEFKDR